MKQLRQRGTTGALLIFTRGSGMLTVNVIAQGAGALRKGSAIEYAARGGGAWRGIVQFRGV
jgi:hypothetical protein